MISPRQNGNGLPNRCAGEQGYLLLGLLFLFALILIGLAVAAPRIGKEIQREKEVETVHRGEQYKRAIQLYYRKFGSYPTSMAQLRETNKIRFLRQDYIDPMTGKKDWKLLHLGQVQMVALGFFGQTMSAGGTIPGIGTQGVNGIGMPGATGMTGGIGGGSSIGSSSGFGSSSSFGSSTSMTGGGLNSSSTNGLNNSSTNDDSFFNDSSISSANSNGTPSNGNSSTASSGNTTSDSVSSEDQQSSTDDSSDSEDSGFGSGGSSSVMSSNFGQNGMSSGGMNSSSIFGSSSPTGNSAASGSFGSSGAPSIPGLPGSTAAGMNGTGAAGGGPIVGVTVPLKKASILVYRKQKVYDKWQFVYNPQEEIAAAIGQTNSQTPGAGIGTPAGMSSSGQSGTSSLFGPSGGGIGSSSGGFGSNSNSFGSSPSSSSGFGTSTGSGSNQNQSNPF